MLTPYSRYGWTAVDRSIIQLDVEAVDSMRVQRLYSNIFVMRAVNATLPL